MRITGVRSVTCEIALQRPIVMGDLRFDAREYIVVMIETDEGIAGVGFGMTRGAPVGSIVERNLAPLLVGQDPFLTEAIGTRLTDRNLTIAGRGIFARALSAVDIALWDIKGQALGQPIWRLLGGAREPSRCRSRAATRTRPSPWTTSRQRSRATPSAGSGRSRSRRIRWRRTPEGSPPRSRRSTAEARSPSMPTGRGDAHMTCCRPCADGLASGWPSSRIRSLPN